MSQLVIVLLVQIPLISLLTRFSIKIISHFFVAFLQLILFISEMINQYCQFLEHFQATLLQASTVDIIDNYIVLILASNNASSLYLLLTYLQTSLINLKRVSEQRFYLTLYYYFRDDIFQQKFGRFFRFYCIDFVILNFIIKNNFRPISVKLTIIKLNFQSFIINLNEQQPFDLHEDQIRPFFIHQTYLLMISLIYENIQTNKNQNFKLNQHKLQSQNQLNKNNRNKKQLGIKFIPQYYKILSDSKNMSLHKSCVKLNQNYQVRQRYIPTFVHQPIFDDQPLRPHLSRCTPTFHSTVLDTDGYNVKTIHHKKQKDIVRPNTAVEKSVYVNNTHEKRIQDLNPHFHNPYNSRDKWFDHTKQNLLQTIKNCNVHGYSKQRKYADLSSDPVFTSFDYAPRNATQYKNSLLNQCTNCTCTKGCCSTQVCCKNDINSSRQVVNQPVIVQTNKQPQQSVQKVAAPDLQDSLDNVVINKAPGSKKQQKQKKDFHKECVPENTKQLGLKGKKIKNRPQSAVRPKIVSQKPTFTVIRKNRIVHNG